VYFIPLYILCYAQQLVIRKRLGTPDLHY
jgi:hypothetical protein